ncbi:multicopper oxidase domain-containing protein [Pseudomonas aeruginosa]
MSDTSGKNPYPSFWQINGKAWEGGEEHKHNAPPLAKLKEGQSYIFELRNMAQYQHPIHLHGMAFKVLDLIKGHHPVLHRHLPAGQERDRPRRAGGGQSACGCSTATSSTIWRPARWGPSRSARPGGDR